MQRQDGNRAAGPHKPAPALLSVLRVEGRRQGPLPGPQRETIPSPWKKYLDRTIRVEGETLGTGSNEKRFDWFRDQEARKEMSLSHGEEGSRFRAEEWERWGPTGEAGEMPAGRLSSENAEPELPERTAEECIAQPQASDRRATLGRPCCPGAVSHTRAPKRAPLVYVQT